MEVMGGFHPDMVRFVDGLARAHGARLGADELIAPWSARSFRAIHVQRISVALQLAAAEEILDTILLDRSTAAPLTHPGFAGALGGAGVRADHVGGIEQVARGSVPPLGKRGGDRARDGGGD